MPLVTFSKLARLRRAEAGPAPHAGPARAGGRPVTAVNTGLRR